jgi:hypothetical protein
VRRTVAHSPAREQSREQRFPSPPARPERWLGGWSWNTGCLSDWWMKWRSWNTSIFVSSAGVYGWVRRVSETPASRSVDGAAVRTSLPPHRGRRGGWGQLGFRAGRMRKCVVLARRPACVSSYESCLRESWGFCPGICPGIKIFVLGSVLGSRDLSWDPSWDRRVVLGCVLGIGQICPGICPGIFLFCQLWGPRIWIGLGLDAHFSGSELRGVR